MTTFEILRTQFGKAGETCPRIRCLFVTLTTKPGTPFPAEIADLYPETADGRSSMWLDKTRQVFCYVLVESEDPLERKNVTDEFRTLAKNASKALDSLPPESLPQSVLEQSDPVLRWLFCLRHTANPARSYHGENMRGGLALIAGVKTELPEWWVEQVDGLFVESALACDALSKRRHREPPMGLVEFMETHCEKIPGGKKRLRELAHNLHDKAGKGRFTLPNALPDPTHSQRNAYWPDELRESWPEYVLIVSGLPPLKEH